jgi:hypothetical protein
MIYGVDGSHRLLSELLACCFSRMASGDAAFDFSTAASSSVLLPIPSRGDSKAEGQVSTASHPGGYFRRPKHESTTSCVNESWLQSVHAADV